MDRPQMTMLHRSDVVGAARYYGATLVMLRASVEPSEPLKDMNSGMALAATHGDDLQFIAVRREGGWGA